MPYAISGGLYTVYFSVDLALLGSLSPPAEAAYYRVACAFIALAVAIPIAMNSEVFRPSLYYLLGTCEPRVAEARRVSRQLLRVSLALGAAVSLTMMTQRLRQQAFAGVGGHQQLGEAAQVPVGLDLASTELCTRFFPRAR